MDYKPLLVMLLDTLKISKKRFAESIGVSQGNASDWFNKPNARPSIDALKRICEVHNVNINWFLTGVGEMFISNSPPAASIESIPNLTTLKSQIEIELLDLARERLSHKKHGILHIPVVADIAAGYPAEVYNDEPLSTIAIDKSLIPHPESVFCCRVSGHSMEPLIRHHDIVFVTTDFDREDTGRHIYAFRDGEGITLKLLVLDNTSEKCFLFPLNNAYEPLIYESDSNLIMIGKLILSLRQFD